MTAGPAWQREESAWEEGPPAIPELDTSDVPASVTRLRRSSVDTVPTSDPLTVRNAERPDWCVDMGELLLTMSTFELWTAIEKAAVAPWMRVWREGMECWTPVQEVPELRWAVQSVPRWSFESNRDESAEEPVSRPIATSEGAREIDDGPAALRGGALVEEVLAAEERAVRAGSRPLSRGSIDEATPAPLDTTPAPTAADTTPRRETRRGAGWLAGGSAVAAAAIVIALLRAASHAAPIASAPAAAGGPDTASMSASEAARAVDAATRAEQARALDEARARETSGASTAPRPSDTGGDDPTPRVRREERGQRRLPRGGRRAPGPQGR